jgi:hypothetical protein
MKTVLVVPASEARSSLSFLWPGRAFRAVSALVLALALAACDEEVTPSEQTTPRVRSSEVVARFAPGTFLENVASAADGTLFITAMHPDGRSELLRLKPGQAPESVVPMEDIGSAVVAPDGTLYFTITAFSRKGNLPQVHRVSASGERTTLATLPANAFPNGLTLDARGNLFVADSALSRVWRIPAGGTQAEVWLEHELLAPGQGLPGANGVKLWQGALYVSNSASGNLLRIPLAQDGSALTPVVHARVEGPDDFAVDRYGGLYVTQHIGNSLTYVAPAGDSSQVLAGTAEGLWGPTAAAFDRRSNQETFLYVVTDGNFFGSLLAPQTGGNPNLEETLVVRFDVGVRGPP